jgi:calmodulin|mmetsp:Transcript_32273/g.30768  ORF Transcript_32273/g.30768 Transcript_32273/m.30768 type:complete len:161 (-) Transcript_32273:327-809(-)|eukprot:CAMPEP_0119042468 /NCGR_PEP_ID=MMETSP1177-20130426/15330_1 /TAXON_ID=2985 /ORGANISM="Ochromonas sp, Strain CCMP1899" /LENGTH=160 /DNA_ID=CAMNT_0007009289 /DNA_START=113 /DNA_END=595 /DNA_ORIENTATION=+
METKSQEWIESNQTKIREVFELFDRDKSDAILQEEIGTVMRALGAFPSEKQLIVDILPQLSDDENSGFIAYKNFEKKMLSILANREFEPDTIDILLQAFRTIDKKNNGFISADELGNLLSSRGTAFRPKELESFFAVAKDPETGNIYYEDYAALLVRSIP